MRTSPWLLETRDLTKEFSGLRAVSGVSLEVAEGTIHALVGPTGAGKSTLFNLLTGFMAPTSGDIRFRGEDIAGRPPEQIAHLGIARSFQTTRLLAELSAVDHVELVLASSAGPGLRCWRSRRQLGQFRARALDLLDEVGLTDVSDAEAGSLAPGQMRALELGLALASDPQLLLLDEPATGLGVGDVDRLIGLVTRMAEGRTVVLVDHNLHVVECLADTVTVLQSGQVLAQGSYAQVGNDERVIAAYLGQAG